MTETDTQRYNLVFAGQMLPDTEPEEARRILATFFGLNDPAAVEVFFSGKPVPLRRNLRHSEALRLYRQLRSMGLICDIPKIPDSSPGKAKPRAHQPKRRDHNPPRDNTLPTRTSQDPASQIATNAAARRRKTAPNLFAMRPALIEGQEADLRERSQLRALVAGAIAVTLCLIVGAVTLRFPPSPAGPEPLGPMAATGLSNGRLVIMLPGALLVHARSGLERERIEAADLGLSALSPPLRETSDGSLILGGRDASGEKTWRCDIAARLCAGFATALGPGKPVGFAESYLGETRFALLEDQHLLRLNGADRVEAEASLSDARAPLLYRDGLLLAPQRAAPLIGVYRPDIDGFGSQLDALLLNPEASADLRPSEIQDVAAVGEVYYVLMADPSERAGLYRFDASWGTGERIALAEELDASAYLVAWRDRVLVATPRRETLQRVAPGGRLEAAFTSPMLTAAHDAWVAEKRQKRLRQRLGRILPLTLALLAVLIAGVHISSLQALKAVPRVSTGLLDPMPANIDWRSANPEAAKAAGRIGALLMGAAIAPGLIAAGADRIPTALCCIPAVCAAIYARRLLIRGCGGYLGLRAGEVILLDYDGRYFHGRPAALRQALGFVFSTSVALPLSTGGIRNIDHRELSGITAGELTFAEMIGQLWQLKHPWVHAAAVMIVGVSVSTAGVLLVAA